MKRLLMSVLAQSHWIACVVLVTAFTAGCTSSGDSDAGSSSASAATAAASALPSRSDPLTPPPGSEPLPGATAERLQAVIDDWVAGDNNIGITATVVTEDGTWQGAAGEDGAGEELVPESAMAIASITKTFVAGEVMRLAGLGLVDLDAPVTDYAPVPFDTNGATVRQVLGMRSGFPLDPVGEIFESAAKDLDRSWTTADSIALADADGPRHSSLGEFDYNNLNCLVLGQMIEQVTGEPLAVALTRDLIEPAGLERVWVQDAQQPEPPLTVSEEAPDLDTVDDDGPWLPSRSVASSAGPAGGIAADAPSIARWGYLLYGGHVIDSALVEQMTEPSWGGALQWYGLGTAGWVQGKDVFVGHGGDIVTYHGNLVMATADDVSIAVLVPAPARYRPEVDVETSEVPDLLLEALTQR
jgi:D-alanyl-D-alanine carboxypeptidase